jgi:hypothetical protein
VDYIFNSAEDVSNGTQQVELNKFKVGKKHHYFLQVMMLICPGVKAAILFVNHEVIIIMSPIGSLVIVLEYCLQVICYLEFVFCIDKWLRVTCYNQLCKPWKVTYILYYLPQGGESSPRGGGICAPALPEVLTHPRNAES